MYALKKFGAPKIIFLFLGITLASYAAILILENSLAALSFPGILDRQYGFSYAQAYRQIDAYTAEAGTLYLYVQLADMAFLAGYGVFFAGLIVFLCGKLFPNRPNMTWLALLGLAAAASDCLENIGLFAMIRIHPAPYPVVAALTSGMGVAKVILFFLCSVLSITGLAAWILKVIRAHTVKN